MTYKCDITIFRQKASGPKLSAFDTGKLVQIQSLKYLEFNKEKTIDNKKRLMIISSPSQSEIPKGYFDAMKEETTPLTGETDMVKKMEIDWQLAKREPMPAEERKGIFKIFKFLPLQKVTKKKMLRKVRVLLEKYSPTPLNGLTVDELEKAYRSSVFETLDNGRKHCFVMEIDTNNWCFLVAVVSGQQLRMIPILSEELIKYTLDKMKDTVRNHGKEQGFFDRHTWILPCVFTIVGIIILWVYMGIVGPKIEAATIRESVKGITTGFSEIFTKVTVNIDNVSTKIAGEIIRKYGSVNNITVTGTPPSMTG